MPSKKPQFVIRTEQEVLDKICSIASTNERSTNQEIVYVIKKYISEFENQHGKIEIKHAQINGDNGTINM